MPLIHSKRPSAFKKNIEIEMKHGKPQKQAVAIAYSEKREAEKRDREHKYDGGECMACGGGVCKMSGGGPVLEPHMPGTNTKGFGDGPEKEPAMEMLEKPKFPHEPEMLAKGGEVDGDEMEISHGLGKELMGAFESKDHKKLMDALEACILHCMSKGDE